MEMVLPGDINASISMLNETLFSSGDISYSNAAQAINGSFVY